ncbi:MAG TPA: D-alanine--D-alanine ligase family protein [Thermoanaerobaculia bacterium]|nr:D-alanine--D-alanine ligase family protein [Thermoanaerobaculia bacterium]
MTAPPLRGKKRVGVVFGGPSREHGVSFLSARCLLENLPGGEYEAIPIFVGKDGLWHGPQASRAEMDRQLARPPKDLLLDGVKPGSRPARTSEIVDSFFSAWHAAGADVLFPIVHGTFGEDGVVQGLFESLGVPYVGCGVAASAVGMDKIFMKAAFAAASLPQVKYVGLSRAEWKAPAARAALVTRIDGLGYPVFVKPSCAGSSVGVSKVREASDLANAVEAALLVDSRALAEKGVDAREIECSVIEGGNGGPTEASRPGEVVPGHEFYDYEDKYIDDGAKTIVPADLPESLREEVRRLAARAFDVIGGEGFARVDFFLERGTRRILVNEINSLPGFTPISMFPKMWEASGLPLPQLLDRLVKTAFRRPARGR